MVMWVVHEQDMCVKTNTQTGLQLTLARALINGSLSCMRPAVSTSTTSYPCCCAGKEVGVADQSHTHTLHSPNPMASMAIPAASLP